MASTASWRAVPCFCCLLARTDDGGEMPLCAALGKERWTMAPATVTRKRDINTASSWRTSSCASESPASLVRSVVSAKTVNCCIGPRWRRISVRNLPKSATVGLPARMPSTSLRSDIRSSTRARRSAFDPSDRRSVPARRARYGSRECQIAPGPWPGTVALGPATASVREERRGSTRLQPAPQPRSHSPRRNSSAAAR